jgi:hypothetical protein
MNAAQSVNRTARLRSGMAQMRGLASLSEVNDQSPRPASEDAFLGTADPRAWPTGEISGEGEQPKGKPTGCEPGGSQKLIIKTAFAAIAAAASTSNAHLGMEASRRTKWPST